MKKTAIFLLAVVFVAAFTLACCNPERMAERIVERAMEEEGGGDVDIDLGGKVPSDMPDELVYPGAKVVGSFSMKSDEGGGSSVVLETSSSLSRVTRYYENLDDKGWDIEMTYSGSGEGGEGSMLGMTKGKVGAAVTISKEDGKTNIAIFYGEDIDY